MRREIIDGARKTFRNFANLMFTLIRTFFVCLFYFQFITKYYHKGEFLSRDSQRQLIVKPPRADRPSNHEQQSKIHRGGMNDLDGVYSMPCAKIITKPGSTMTSSVIWLLSLGNTKTACLPGTRRHT